MGAASGRVGHRLALGKKKKKKEKWSGVVCLQSAACIYIHCACENACASGEGASAALQAKRAPLCKALESLTSGGQTIPLNDSDGQTRTET